MSLSKRTRFFVACHDGDAVRVTEAVETMRTQLDEVCVTTGAALATARGHVDVLALLVASSEQANRPVVPSGGCRDAMLRMKRTVASGLRAIEGRTLLMHACVCRQHACAAHLLACGADVDAADIVAEKMTALTMCCKGGVTNLAALLVDSGASVDGTRASFWPIAVAANNRSEGCCRLLLERGATLAPLASLGWCGNRIELMVRRAALLRASGTFSLDWTPRTHFLFPRGDRVELSRCGLAALRVTRAWSLPDDVALRVVTLLARALHT